MKLALDATQDQNMLLDNVAAAKQYLESCNIAYHMKDLLSAFLLCADDFVSSPSNEGAITDVNNNLQLTRYEQISLLFNKGIEVAQLPAAQMTTRNVVNEYFARVISTLENMDPESSLRKRALTVAKKCQENFNQDQKEVWEDEAVSGIMLGASALGLIFMAYSKDPMWFLKMSLAGYAAGKIPLPGNKYRNTLLQKLVSNDKGAFDAGLFLYSSFSIFSYQRILKLTAKIGDTLYVFAEKTSTLAHQLVQDMDLNDAQSTLKIVTNAALMVSKTYDESKQSQEVTVKVDGNLTQVSVNNNSSPSYCTAGLTLFKAILSSAEKTKDNSRNKKTETAREQLTHAEMTKYLTTDSTAADNRVTSFR